jgi:UDP-N-acetylmuramoyl-tripeptide--D-alanyl-D-alanine ligase
MITALHILGHFALVMLLGYYLILNLQWYNYKPGRIILHHHAPWQHIPLFLLPIFAYYALREWVVALDILYAVALYLWLRRVKKKLVFTGRVKRFFAALALFTIIGELLCLARFGCGVYPVVLPLLLALIVSMAIERLLFLGFMKEARKKLDRIDPTIVAVTASYGKTSIKNFIHQLIAEDLKAYKTPRSVNTLAGILKDINESLPADTQVYIVEAGAREPGDIAEIARFLRHHYAVVGKIGPQHIEYFKSLERIILTKLELLQSPRLKKAFVWDGVEIKSDPKIVPFGFNVKNIKESLEGIEFDLELDDGTHHFKAPVLGGLNALNIAAAILVARELGLEMERIRERVAQLQSVEHRLQPIRAGGKLIIDDSFNGNLEGMLSSYDLAAQHPGRKVVVTPGIFESGPEANERLAKKIAEVFDLAIITGRTNREILHRHIGDKAIVVEDKSRLEEVLAHHTRGGDLILFSNDAPEYL